MRILQVDSPRLLERLMQEIKVDPYGIKIMYPKGINHVIRINALSNITANILKQEMLSLGADAAIARDALTGKTKKTDCLLIGNLSQFGRLNKKLLRQPFGLSKLADELNRCLSNYQQENFTIDLGRFRLSLGKNALVMGIINLTPDSFSGDGIYAQNGRLPLESVLEIAERLIQEGADILDLGGESSRPGARAVSLKEELGRVLPVIKVLAKKAKVPISIDTRRPEVARQVLDNGAVIINDITGLRNDKMVRVISRYKCAAVMMHMQGNPRTMQKAPSYVSLIDEIIAFLRRSMDRAAAAGFDKNRIIIDPGIGFGKTLRHNLEILQNLKEFKVLGRPILVGPSRKSFIGKITQSGPQARLSGTISSCVLAVQNGAKIVRVHDVRQVKEALAVIEAVSGLKL